MFDLMDFLTFDLRIKRIAFKSFLFAVVVPEKLMYYKYCILLCTIEIPIEPQQKIAFIKMASVQKFACSDAAVQKMCPHANEKIFYNNVN